MFTNAFKYHISCTDEKILVRIILITYFSTVVPLTSYVFFPVGLSSLTRPFENVALTTKGLQGKKLVRGTTVKKWVIKIIITKFSYVNL